MFFRININYFSEHQRQIGVFNGDEGKSKGISVTGSGGP
jgi:hypothetical protein